MTPSPASPITIQTARGPLLLPAAHRLAEASTGTRGEGERLLEAARLNAISFQHFWASIDPDRPSEARQVCLVVPGSGRTGMFFTSRPRTSEEEHELGRVIRHACDELPRRLVRLAQAIVEPGEEEYVRAYQAGGMPPLATLAYLSRPTPTLREFPEEATRADLPPGVTLRGYAGPRDDEILLDLLPRTYEGTMDCPELSNTRPPEDVLASHRATGAWAPELWWIIEREGVPGGAALFNAMPETGTIELVYFGIVPELRGSGAGRRILARCFSSLAGRGQERVTCACDVRNTPALRMYEGIGMEREDERLALVRILE